MKATVDFIMYPKGVHAPGFTIFRHGGSVCKGSVSWALAVGDRLILDGKWKPDSRRPANGPVFFFSSAEPDLPTDPRACLAYAITLTMGLGPAKEDAIWDAYGDDWPLSGRLDKISGLRESARDSWLLTLARLGDEKHKTKAMSWMITHGITDKMAGAAWERWGRDVQGVVANDPYCLSELPGYGFLAIDNGIRQSLGIADDDPRRYSAAAVYSAKQHCDSTGATIMHSSELYGRAMMLVGVCDIDKAIDNSPMLARMGDDVTLKRDFEIESRIFERMFQ